MRRVIGGDDVNGTREEGVTKRLAVVERLDRGVPLDAVAVGGIIGVGEPEVMHAGLGRDLLLRQWPTGGEERKLALGRDVQHVQAHTHLIGQLNNARRGGVAGFGVADLGVKGGRKILTHEVDVALAVALDDGFLFGVDGDGQVGLAKDAADGVGVHGAVAGGGSEEELEAGHVGGIEATDLVGVVVRSTEVEGVVGRRCIGRARHLPLPFAPCNGLGVRVGHVHEGGHAAGHGRTTLAGDGALVRHAGFAEMHMVVDHAGQQPLAAGVDHGGAVHTRRLAFFIDRGDECAVDQYRSDKRASLVDDHGVLNQCVHIRNRRGGSIG